MTYLSSNLVINPIVRTFAALAIAWVIFGVVESAAGMTGWFTILWSVVLAIAVLVLNNFVLAELGIKMYSARGAAPLSPSV